MVNYTSDFRTVGAQQVCFSPGFPVLDGDVVVDGSTFYLQEPRHRAAVRRPLVHRRGEQLHRYVRHANHLGRLDAYPFDPHADQLWRMVPGLASSSGVSFESVNYPGRFLRHADYEIRLDANDGTATFCADATFTRVAGLADAAWSSFRSHNVPDRYLRHLNYTLRIDPISTATERSDATFRVVS